MYDFVNPQLLHSKNPEKFLPIKNEFRRPVVAELRGRETNDDDGESECIFLLCFMNDQAKEFTYS